MTEQYDLNTREGRRRGRPLVPEANGRKNRMKHTTKWEPVRKPKNLSGSLDRFFEPSPWGRMWNRLLMVWWDITGLWRKEIPAPNDLDEETIDNHPRLIPFMRTRLLVDKPRQRAKG